MGIAVKELLALDYFKDFYVVAGRKGGYKEIQGITMLEAPDGFRWSVGKELILSSGYAIQQDPDCIRRAFEEGSFQRAAAMMIKRERYLPQIPKDIMELCDKYDVKMNPVGHVFENILKVDPDIRLHWFDGAHAGPYGSYANALCTYKTIFGDSIENASDESYDMYPVDGDTALCDRDRLLVKLDCEKALTIRKTVEAL